MCFVWRKDHEDLKRQLAERDAELRHILNLMWKQGFGVALFAEPGAGNVTPAIVSEVAPTVEAEPELTPEEEMELERSGDLAELTRIRRTSPSKLGPALSRMMARQQERLVKAAHPNPNGKVSQAFERAKQEVT